MLPIEKSMSKFIAMVEEMLANSGHEWEIAYISKRCVYRIKFDGHEFFLI